MLAQLTRRLIKPDCAAAIEEVPMVWVDRLGLKLGLHETHTRNSKATYGFVLEEVTTRDEQGGVVSIGRKAGSSGGMLRDGPPTTHSSKGRDRVLFLQGNVTRDATHYINGTPVGCRDQLTVWVLQIRHDVQFMRSGVCIG